jgi:hypothetical protein
VKIHRSLRQIQYQRRHISIKINSVQTQPLKRQLLNLLNLLSRLIDNKLIQASYTIGIVSLRLSQFQKQFISPNFLKKVKNKKLL